MSESTGTISAADIDAALKALNNSFDKKIEGNSSKEAVSAISGSRLVAQADAMNKQEEYSGFKYILRTLLSPTDSTYVHIDGQTYQQKYERYNNEGGAAEFTLDKFSERLGTYVVPLLAAIDVPMFIDEINGLREAIQSNLEFTKFLHTSLSVYSPDLMNLAEVKEAFEILKNGFNQVLNDGDAWNRQEVITPSNLQNSTKVR